MNIYTFGYQSNSFSYFEEQVKSFQLFIADIRFNPYSYLSFWNKDSLSSHFSMYQHIPELGNKKYQFKNEIEIVDLNAGCEKVISMMELGFECLLLCACKELDFCHRKIVAEELKNRTSYNIVHL